MNLRGISGILTPSPPIVNDLSVSMTKAVGSSIIFKKPKSGVTAMPVRASSRSQSWDRSHSQRWQPKRQPLPTQITRPLNPAPFNGAVVPSTSKAAAVSSTLASNTKAASLATQNVISNHISGSNNQGTNSYSLFLSSLAPYKNRCMPSATNPASLCSVSPSQSTLASSSLSSSSAGVPNPTPPQICIYALAQCQLKRKSNSFSCMSDPSIQSQQLVKLINKLNQTTGANDYDIKTGGRCIACIKPRSFDAYKLTIKVLESDKNIRFNTYLAREQRATRVIVRGIPASTPTTRISNELTQLGFRVKNVQKYSTHAPNIFFIELEQGHTLNHRIFEVKRLCQRAVIFERPKPSYVSIITTASELSMT
ncbi:hypothetical protein ACLKA7_005497 [Drosophila subpalustris]